MLPKTFDCLYCREQLELEESERSLESIKCPACGKDNKAADFTKSAEVPLPSQYSKLRSYASAARIPGSALAGIIFYLCIQSASALPTSYQIGVIVLGIALGLSVGMFFTLMSESLKALADIADNSHKATALLRYLLDRR